MSKTVNKITVNIHSLFDHLIILPQDGSLSKEQEAEITVKVQDAVSRARDLALESPVSP